MPKPRSTPSDEAWIRHALVLAGRGRGFVEPNPMVGCVLVRGGKRIGSGYHRRFGGPHAEVEALRHCAVNPHGATAYVTLEPCCHHGKTPPCTDALIAAGIQRVVAAITDPFSSVAGGGCAALRAAGVTVEVGLCAAEAAALNAPYLKRVSTGRPWIILKWAQSLDGRIATHRGDSRWISDEHCRQHAHRVRANMDGIIVGVGTVLSDDPLLTCRFVRPRRSATRIVLDTHLRTPLRSQLVRTAAATPTWIFCGRNASPARQQQLEKFGCRVTRVALHRGRVGVRAVLNACGQAGMTNVLVEGGSAVHGTFLDGGWADELHAYFAPLLLGGAGAPGAVGGQGVATVADAQRFASPPTWRRLGHGWLVQGRLQPRRAAQH